MSNQKQRNQNRANHRALMQYLAFEPVLEAFTDVASENYEEITEAINTDLELMAKKEDPSALGYE
jgi:hypothetical protein